MDKIYKKIIKLPRKFFSENLDITNWENVEKELKKLDSELINSVDDLILFLEKVSELSNITGEESAQRYIKMTRFANEEKYATQYNDFYKNIVAKCQPYYFKFDKKFYDSTFRQKLDSKKYAHLNKIIANSIELYREENIPLQVKERELANKYGALFSKLTVIYKGEEKTLSQLAPLMKDRDRAVREEVWKLKMGKMAEKKVEFNTLFDEMKELRIQQAKNAGFDNYRDYIHQSMGRFSYTPSDVMKFHDAVEKDVIPFLKKLTEKRKKVLNLDSVKPWDTSIDLDGKILKPFKTIDEFLNKGIEILHEIKPKFGENLGRMKASDLLDLENRKGKAPGGYNYPLMETGAPFIFMNAVGLHGDVVTLLHEAGHAMHTFATKNINLGWYQDTPSEVAELASMGMEFISMDYWNKYYRDENDFKKAKRDQLEGALSFLPWCMIVDNFQHWIYLNPKHTVAERDDYFIKLLKRFSTDVDWSNFTEYEKNIWLFQLHIFEIPFYYIEYGISQLGALSIYKNYKKIGKEETLANYENFLELGYKVPVDKLYEAAGIKFDFSSKYVCKLVKFVEEELAKID